MKEKPKFVIKREITRDEFIKCGKHFSEVFIQFFEALHHYRFFPFIVWNVC